MHLTPEQKQMVEDNIKLAYFAAHKFTGHFQLDYDDILSACYIGLIKAARGYNSDKAKFSTYAMQIMFRNIQRELFPRKPQVETLYLEDITNTDEQTFWQDVIPDTRQFEDEFIHDLLAEQYLQTINNSTKFSQKTKDIVNLHFYHPELTQIQIGEILNCNQVNVSRTYREMSKRYRDELAV